MKTIMIMINNRHQFYTNDTKFDKLTFKIQRIFKFQIIKFLAFLVFIFGFYGNFSH